MIAACRIVTAHWTCGRAPREDQTAATRPARALALYRTQRYAAPKVP